MIINQIFLDRIDKILSKETKYKNSVTQIINQPIALGVSSRGAGEKQTCQVLTTHTHSVELNSKLTPTIGIDYSENGDYTTMSVVQNPNNGGFVLPEPRGTLVETLHGDQGLGMSDAIEYFQRNLAKSMAIPSYMMKLSQQAEFMKAQLSTTIPPMVVNTDSEIGKNFIRELRANKFDYAMELVK